MLSRRAGLSATAGLSCFKLLLAINYYESAIGTVFCQYIIKLGVAETWGAGTGEVR